MFTEIVSNFSFFTANANRTRHDDDDRQYEYRTMGLTRYTLPKNHGFRNQSNLACKALEVARRLPS
jgi:hypothetical protein